MKDAGSLFRASVARPVGALVAFATLLVVGFIAYQRLPLELLPSGWRAPELNVWIPNPGSNAQENEDKVVRVIEEELRTLSGIESVSSRSEEGRVRMWIEFDPSLDLDIAKAEVRDRIERARPRLPSTIQEIGMWSEDAADLPISFFGVTHPGDNERTDYLIEKIVKPRIEAVDGISNVEIWGILQDSVRILLDEERVRAASLDVGQLIQRLASDNFAMPMGDMDDGGTWTLVRTDMRFHSLEEIEAYPIGDGLTIGDIGTVVKAKSVRDSLSRIDGNYAYWGMASKESQANIVQASRDFRAALQEIENDPAVRGELEFLEFLVQGDIIESSLDQLRETALWGSGLAVLVLLVFLRRVRLTLCVALSIPVAALMALTWEFFTGGTLNILTMAGITLGIGMLVDNSVVVVENIARLRGEGLAPKEAAATGAAQIGMAVTLATLTTVVVLTPIIFMVDHPQVRLLFAGLGLPLCVSLIASLLVALVFLPVVTARLLGDRPRWMQALARALGPVGRVPARLFAALFGAGRWLLWVGLRAARIVERIVLAPLVLPVRWAIAIALPVLAYLAWRASLPDAHLASELARETITPEHDAALLQSRMILAVAASLLVLLGVPRWRRRRGLAPAAPAGFAPGGSSAIELIAHVNRGLVGWTLQHRFLASFLAAGCFLSIVIPVQLLDFSAFLSEDSQQEVSFGVRFGADFTLAEASHEMRRYEDFLEERRDAWGFAHHRTRFDIDSGRINVSWSEPQTPDELDERLEELKNDLPRWAGHSLRFWDEEDRSDRNRSVVSFPIRGTDWKELERVGAEAVALLERVEGLEEIDSPLEDAPDMLEVDIDRDLALSMGVNADATQQSIAWALRGFMLPRYQEGGVDYPFYMEWDEEDVAGIQTVRELPIYTEATQVPLASFASISATKASRSIRRENGRSTFNIRARVADPTRRSEVEAAGWRALAQLTLPRGFSLGLEDSDSERQALELGEMQKAAWLAVVLMVLLMAILLESLLLPLSVIPTMFFAAMGAMWTMLVTGIAMDFMGMIGLILLFGVVVNNGIVLLDRIHRLVQEGRPRDEAVLEGCSQRVRPVLMTALTTVCGLLPMAMAEPTTNSVPYQALAAIVAGGLMTSTVFTLWVVPLAYTLFDDLGKALLRWLGWGLGAADALRPAERATTAS